MQEPISPEQIEQTIAFHGHQCPGLWIGIRAAELCRRELGAHQDQAPLVAVVETDMCGVDAIQVLTGCTFGKGNLIHRDYGKSAFSFFRRRDGKGLRALFRNAVMGETGPELRELMKKVFAGQASEAEKKRAGELKEENRQKVMAASLEELFTISEPGPIPRGAKILDSLECVACGESTMESRTRRFAGQTYCIPCFEQVEQKK
ncbi:FmdE family protein [Desulfurivibrio sp. D14AmB]|uniref:FmdE family protein n=1 Tax=Desulfurivibrio sp. D14AmB TaxID=3374370 RepID=UPI00376EC5AE